MPGEVTQQTAFALVAVWWQFVPVPGEDHLLVITDAAARLGSKEWLCRHGDRLPFRCCGSPAASSAPAWCLGTAYPCAARSPSSARGAVAGLWRPSASGKRKRRLPPPTSRRASD